MPPHEYPPLTIGEAEVQVFTLGTALYADMLNAIRGAERRILIDMFIWKGDRVGQQFKVELLRAAQRGVEVYAIVAHIHHPQLRARSP